MSAAAQERLTRLWETPHTLWGELTTVDHKKLGKRYIATAFFFLIIGGLEALVMRLQLAAPNRGMIDPETYYQIFTMHGITMIFWYAGPILSGFGIYLIPLMLGSRDLAFPRLNAFTYWTYLFSGLLLYGSSIIYEAPRGGWFAYVPLTNKPYSPGLGIDFWLSAGIRWDLHFRPLSEGPGIRSWSPPCAGSSAAGNADSCIPARGAAMT
jgi:heme/copper-type cytochrome/quinol oxidase subunit 1